MNNKNNDLEDKTKKLIDMYDKDIKSLKKENEQLKNQIINLKIQNESIFEYIITKSLNKFIKKLQKLQILNEENIDEINKELNKISSKLIKPILNENTNLAILNIINRSLGGFENMSKLFLFSNNSKNIINLENSNIICEIIYDLIMIFINRKDESEYLIELQFILISLLDLIKKSKETFNKTDKYPIIYIYQLLYKLITTNKIILSNFIDKDIINILLSKIEQENKDIRRFIYDILIFTIKQTTIYNKELFELKKEEKEGIYDFKDKDPMLINEGIIYLLFEEKKELLLLLLIIFEYNDEFFTKEFNKYIYKLFNKFGDKNKDEDLLEILLAIIKINDKYTFDRLLFFFGYPRLVIKPIKREKIPYNCYNNSDSSDSEKEENEKPPEEIKQKWPLFGERLIDGDINKHVYEYITNNHRENNICLLSMLFSRENNNEDNEKKENENVKKGSTEEIDNEEDETEEEKNLEITISEELKKKILYDILNNCLGEKNNYALFKYIYLMPARSILYKNLYEEIKLYLKKDKNINLEKFGEKEKNKIEKIGKDIKNRIEKVNATNKKDIIDDDNDFVQNDEENNAENNEFKCLDNRIKNYIGFVSDIIPGEIIREEIEEIAKTRTMAIYRLSYYTKFFKIDELRSKLLENYTNNIKNIKIQEIMKINEDINKRKEQKLETEILEKLDERKKTEIYEVSEKNENSFIYTLPKKNMHTYILEDSSLKNKNGVKNTFVRFVFLNIDQKSRRFLALIKEKRDILNLEKINFFNPGKILDKTERNNISDFYSIYRLRGELPFIKTESLGITIDFNG